MGPSSSRGFTRGRLGLLGFIHFRVASLGRTQGTSGPIEFAWVHSAAPSGGRVDKGQSGFTRACLGVVEFIGVRVGSLGRAYVS